MKRIITFGELMMRLSPAGSNRLKQATNFESCFGGSEANVAYALASFETPTAFVSVLPDNVLGEAAVEALYQKTLDTQTIQFSREGRMGIYFLETAYGHRKCLYDRSSSSFALSKRNDYNWEEILKNASLFHFSGITPALSSEMPFICEDACIVAKKKGIPVSIDINYRNQLWDKKNASTIMRRLCHYADILFINEEEFSLLGIDESANSLLEDPCRFKAAAEQICEDFAVKTLTSAKRTMICQSQAKIKAMIYQKTKQGFLLCASREFSTFTVDLNGAGDAYAAAMLYALYHKNLKAKEAINFAASVCALKHNCKGDLLAPMQASVLHSKNRYLANY